jgi:PAS domain S-box-containing protein
VGTSRPLGSSRPRTRKRRANLADLEQRLELLVENVKDYAIFMLDTGGRAITWNVGVERLLGYKEDEFIGLKFDRLFRPADRDAAGQELSRAAEVGRSEDERQHVRKDGTELWVSGVLTALREPSGRARGFAKVMRDTTAGKLALIEREELLRREQEARLQAERSNRAKDEFLAMVSHELRTPLNAILGWTRMLANGQLDANRSQHSIDTIERNAAVLARLVDDLLDASAIVTGKLQLDMQTVSVADVVNAAIESMRHAAEEKQVDLIAAVGQDLVSIEADPRRFQQVVSNLLSNALKFTPAGGHVWVSASQVDDVVEVTVRDTGAGIPATILPHIFERFHQGSAACGNGGLGLGLSIAHQLVEAHHGTLEAYSEGEGHGATFVVRMPVPEGAPARAQVKAQAHRRPRSRLRGAPRSRAR